MNLDKIKKVIPADTSQTRKSLIRARSDYAEVVLDVVLKRRTQTDIAKRLGVNYSTLDRFKERFITDEVVKTIMAEAAVDESTDLDAKINKGQDDVQLGIRDIIKEQKELYKMIRKKVGDDEGQRSIEDMIPALAQLLRDQGQSHERLLKSYTALKDKTTVVLSINESPEWSKLQSVLYDVFERHPDAFEDFQHEVRAQGLRL